jgi:hypothetical protein
VPIVYEVPTHLNVEDTIVFGRTAAQLARFAAAGSLAYGVWDQAVTLPPEARLTLAGLITGLGLACALITPGGRPLDQWALVCLLYAVRPKRLVWRRLASDIPVTPADDPSWAELSPDVDWRADRSDPQKVAR